MYTSTFLNEHGDITITWDDSTVEDVKDMIQEKMNQGYTFFIVEKKFGIIPTQKRLTNVYDIYDHKKVIMRDKEVQKLFMSGKVQLVKEDNSTAQTNGIANTAAQAAQTNTVAVRPAVGG